MEHDMTKDGNEVMGNQVGLVHPLKGIQQARHQKDALCVATFESMQATISSCDELIAIYIFPPFGGPEATTTSLYLSPLCKLCVAQAACAWRD